MGAAVWLEAASLRNPLAEAWRQAFIAAGVDVTGVYSGESEEPLPDGWTRLGSVSGRPTVLVQWWGLGFMQLSKVAPAFPSARRVLIADTFPNASRPLTEIRELLIARSAAYKPDAVVTYSDQMTRALRRSRVFPSPRTEYFSLLQPFPLRMHVDSPPGSPSEDGRSVVFTGRSDFLFEGPRSMAKDRVGPILEKLISRGYSVTVGHPGADDKAVEFGLRGLRIYPRFSNEEILAGELGRLVTMHSYQLATYNATNATVRRRMQNGLSSRFALGLTSNTPIVVPAAATHAHEFLKARGIGLDLSTLLDTPTETGAVADMRERWRAQHGEWAAEGRADDLRRLVRPSS